MSEHLVDRDLETARTVRNWLERTADDQPDNPTGRERLLDQVDRTSQRSARWLPPVFPGGLGAMFPSARFAAAASIVIIFTGLLLLALLPGDESEVVAPANESASPSAPAMPTPVLSASVTGTFVGELDWGNTQERRLEAPISRWAGDVYEVRNEGWAREVEWSDARLPPVMQVWTNRDEYVLDPASPARRGGVTLGHVELEDDRGAWTGRLEGVFPYDDRYATEWLTLAGSGAYEGFHAVLVASHWYDTETFEFRNEIVGLIAEGEPPPARPRPADEDPS